MFHLLCEMNKNRSLIIVTLLISKISKLTDKQEFDERQKYLLYNLLSNIPNWMGILDMNK